MGGCDLLWVNTTHAAGPLRRHLVSRFACRGSPTGAAGAMPRYVLGVLRHLGPVSLGGSVLANLIDADGCAGSATTF